MAAGPLIFWGLFLCAAPLRAQDASDGLTFHGFGSWTYGKTDHNNYLAGLPTGDSRQSSMALNLSAQVDDNLTIHAQGEASDDDDGSHLSLSYAFADYKLTDGLSLHFGQVKDPFGIYTEIFDVGTLRPFLDLPQAVYGPVGFAGESYTGVGLTDTRDFHGWTAVSDVYVGGNDLIKDPVAEEFYHGSTLQEVTLESELQSIRDVVGGRLVLHTPIQGFSVGGSAYTGALNEPANNRATVTAAQIDYRSNRFTFESEIAHEDQVRDERATGGYVQAAYRLTSTWQVGLQLDNLDNVFYGVDPASAPSLQMHREGAVALSYWFSRSLVIKSEFHLVSGNRFAMPDPELLNSVVAAGQLHTITRLFQFGAQFTF